MKILLINPLCPDTFWSFKSALKFVSKKANVPPLGLLTVAAMLPDEWEKKLIDVNVESLRDRDIRRCDLVFITGMTIQQRSVRQIVERCHAFGKRIVAGGPLFTSDPEGFDDIEYLVLNEAEITLPLFLADFLNGTPRHCYSTTLWADITTTPIPRWDLITPRRYSSMNIQYSRGCPYDCEFCDITVLYGHTPRTKSCAQLIGELDALYAMGWREPVFMVDDNFIGNKVKLKKEILPAIILWMERHRYPFALSTEASINLADDDELIDLMLRAGFDAVFIGIESTEEASLTECNKNTNKRRDLLHSVQKLHGRGLRVNGGFILGFDSDPERIFQRMAEFIQESGIVTAMVGLLNAPNGTRLYQRMFREGRLLHAMSGDNTDYSLNFIPKMDLGRLKEGYERVIRSIYSPKEYYRRVKTFLQSYQPSFYVPRRLRYNDIAALFKSIVLLGIVGRERVHYWNLFFWSIVKQPRLFPLAITFTIYGFHFRKVFSPLLREPLV